MRSTAPIVRQLPDPEPAAGQIRIKMAGAAVNPADLHVLDGWGRDVAGGIAPERLLGVGLDVAGVVWTWWLPTSAICPSVRRWRP